METTVSAALVFIAEQPVGVLSTADKKGVCWGSTIFTQAREEDGELVCYFMTHEKSRKYQNILENDHVALTFTMETTLKTLQISGIASTVRGGKERLRLTDMLSEALQVRFSSRTPVHELQGFDFCIVKVKADTLSLSEFS